MTSFERHPEARLSALAPPTGVIVGPEGGFSAGEVTAALTAGTAVAGLGPRLMRSESIALAAAAVILSRAGDFG